MTAISEVLSTVDRYFAALQEGDIDTCLALFTEDGVVWHNYDQAEQPKDEALAELRSLAQLQPRFDIVRRDVLSDCCIQQHVVELSLPNGDMASIPAMQRVYCVDGRISRIEEYMDSAQMKDVMRVLQSAM